MQYAINNILFIAFQIKLKTLTCSKGVRKMNLIIQKALYFLVIKCNDYFQDIHNSLHKIQ